MTLPSYARRVAALLIPLTGQACAECGEKENLRRHHDDYADPLAVRCLCHGCHMGWHKVNGKGKNADVEVGMFFVSPHNAGDEIPELDQRQIFWHLRGIGDRLAKVRDLSEWFLISESQVEAIYARRLAAFNGLRLKVAA